MSRMNDECTATNELQPATRRVFFRPRIFSVNFFRLCEQVDTPILFCGFKRPELAVVFANVTFRAKRHGA